MSGLDVLTVATAVGCGLNAGIFFAFSAFVMDALGRAGVSEGIAVMQSINRRIVTSAFIPVWLGTGLACVALAAWSAVDGGDPRVLLAAAAAALYVLGCIGVTFARNVPMNDRLDAMDAHDPGAAAYWRTYVRSWTGWNHVRTIACVAAAALLTAALAG